MKLSIIIPVYNEARTIVEVLDAIDDLDLISDWEKEVLVINDCSTDDTAELIEGWIGSDPNKGLHLIHQETNQGKGAALARGIKEATGDHVIFQDGDLELDPNDINLLLDAHMATGAPVVFGSRLLTPGSRASFTPMNLLANRILSGMTSLLLMRRVTDMETCYKLIARPLLESIVIQEGRFGVEPELTVKLLKDRGTAYREVPIRYVSRNKEEGKKIGWRDGVRAVYCLLKYRF